MMKKMMETKNTAISTSEWNEVIDVLNTLCSLVALSYAPEDGGDGAQLAFAAHMGIIYQAMEQS
jgi:hypothetical protein